MHPMQTVRYEKLDFLGEGQVCTQNVNKNSFVWTMCDYGFL